MRAFLRGDRISSRHLNRLPEHLTQRLLDLAETGADFHIVQLTLASGKIVQDVAIVDCSIIACVRGKPFVWFAGSDVVDLQVTHRRWGAGYALTR